MIDDFGSLQAICASFTASLHDLDGAIAVRSLDANEADLSRRVGALARRLGWTANLTVRLRPIDLPRAGAFPQRLHQHGARVLLGGPHGAELVLNSNALDLGNFSILIERLPVLLWVFGGALARRPGLTAEYQCFPGDACFWDAVTFSSNAAHACLVPDPDYFRTAGYAGFRDAMTAPPAWETRRGAVLWRGSSSGIKRYWPPAGPADTGWLARLDLCARANAGALAELCDAGFTGFVQMQTPNRAELEAAYAYMRRPPVPKTEFAHYKALFDVDGNSNTWSSGLYCSLLTGACVIKIASEFGFEQWYYDRLEPWVHYVPVKSDLSDLEEQVRRVLADDRMACAIGAAGRELALSMNVAAEMHAAVDRVLAWAAIPDRREA